MAWRPKRPSPVKPWAGDKGGLEAKQLFAVLSETHLLSPEAGTKVLPSTGIFSVELALPKSKGVCGMGGSLVFSQKVRLAVSF